MKVVQVNTADIIGGAGIAAYRLHEALNRNVAITSQLLVGIKASNDKSVAKLFDSKAGYYLNRISHKITSRFGKDGLKSLTNISKIKKTVANADIIHMHNLHGGFFSLPDILKFAEKKPVVWTLHDMWGLTGGCCFPYSCSKFLKGCDGSYSQCNEGNKANQIWEKKQKIYEFSKINLIVSSKWMMNFVANSPLMQHLSCDLIPFGTDLNIYKPHDRKAAKGFFGIQEDFLVVGFRASLDKQKGMSYAINALKRIQTDKKVCVFTVGDTGLVEELKNKYKVLEAGLIKDEKVMAKAYNAMDIFLMPSEAESFGLMAIEAMSCMTPVIAFEKTALEDTIFSPECGVVVPNKNTLALQNKIEEFLHFPEYRNRIGANAYEAATKHYDFNNHVENTISVYKKCVTKNL